MSKRSRCLLGASFFATVVVGVAAAAYAQDAPLPKILHFGITDSTLELKNQARDDLREVPPPKPDRPSPQVSVIVGDGDPNCLPRGWASPASATGNFPGVGRPR